MLIVSAFFFFLFFILSTTTRVITTFSYVIACCVYGVNDNTFIKRRSFGNTRGSLLRIFLIVKRIGENGKRREEKKFKRVYRVLTFEVWNFYTVADGVYREIKRFCRKSIAFWTFSEEYPSVRLFPHLVSSAPNSIKVCLKVFVHTLAERWKEKLHRECKWVRGKCG